MILLLLVIYPEKIFPETYKDVAILLLKDNVERIPIVAGLPDGTEPFVEKFLDCLQAKILTNN